MSKSASPENYPPNFSLLNWLVRLLLYGSVFASVFLPSYVAIELPGYCGRSKHKLPDQVNCNKQVENRNNIGALNRAQQAYSLENNNKFSDSIKDLGLGIKPETANYSYRIVKPMVPVQDLDGSVIPESHFSMRMAIAQYKIKGYGNSPSTRNIIGIVYTSPLKSESGETEIITRAILCDMTKWNPFPTAMPKVNNGIMRCPVGSKQLGQ